MSESELEKLMKDEPVDGATVRQRRKWMILKFLAQPKNADGAHEETIFAALDLITGLTHYRMRVYIGELVRGGYVHRNKGGVCKLAMSLDKIYASVLAVNPHAEIPT